MNAARNGGFDGGGNWQQRQTRDNGRQLMAVAMMKAECDSGGSSCMVRLDERGQWQRRRKNIRDKMR